MIWAKNKKAIIIFNLNIFKGCAKHDFCKQTAKFCSEMTAMAD
jgi:hypothetical protein